MQAFFPVSSKVDLVEAAEAHAWRLDQLAHNLSRYEGRGPGDAAQGPAGQSGPQGGTLLWDILEGGAVVPMVGVGGKKEWKRHTGQEKGTSRGWEARVPD